MRANNGRYVVHDYDYSVPSLRYNAMRATYLLSHSQFFLPSYYYLSSAIIYNVRASDRCFCIFFRNLIFYELSVCLKINNHGLSLGYPYRNRQIFELISPALWRPTIFLRTSYGLSLEPSATQIY